MILNREIRDIFAFQYQDFTLENYQSHPRLVGEVAI
jgi:thymidylate synthase